MTKAALILSLSLFVLTACSDSNETAVNNSNIKEISANLNDPDSPAKKANDNLEELGDLMKIPFETTDGRWREETVDGVRKLSVVIRFEKDEADKLELDSAKHGEPQAVEISMQDWFPNELRTQSDYSMNSTLKGKAYPPNEVLLAPFNSGRLIRIEDNDFFIIELEAK